MKTNYEGNCQESRYEAHGGNINDVNAFIVFSNKMFYLSQKLLKMNSEEFETSSQ